jgi:hypothetical protein
LAITEDIDRIGGKLWNQIFSKLQQANYRKMDF